MERISLSRCPQDQYAEKDSAGVERAGWQPLSRTHVCKCRSDSTIRSMNEHGATEAVCVREGTRPRGEAQHAACKGLSDSLDADETRKYIQSDTVRSFLEDERAILCRALRGRRSARAALPRVSCRFEVIGHQQHLHQAHGDHPARKEWKATFAVSVSRAEIVTRDACRGHDFTTLSMFTSNPVD